MNKTIKFVYETCRWLGVGILIAAHVLVFKGCTLEAALWMIAAALLLIVGKDYAHPTIIQIVTPGANETEQEKAEGKE